MEVSGFRTRGEQVKSADQLFRLRIFDEALGHKLTNAQVASIKRGNGTSYDIRLVEGVIERYDDQDLETWSWLMRPTFTHFQSHFRY